MFAQIMDKKIDYIQIGDKGDDLLFLHGGGGSYRSYTDFLKRLSKNFKVWAIGYPGGGLSSGISKSWKFADYAKIIKEFCEKEKIKPHIVGHSFGGAIAAKSVVDHPSFFKSLTLVSSLTRPLPKKLGLIADVVGRIKNGKLIFKGELKDIILDLIFHIPDLIKIYLKVSKYDLKDDLKKIDIKTLIVWGDKDRVLPLEIGKQTRDFIKNSKLIVKKDGEHFILQQSPVEIAELITKEVYNKK